MSADGRIGLWLTVCWSLLVLSAAAAAEEEEVPDLEFLEYLGSWEASDEDWIIFTEVDETEKASKEKGESDPPPDGEKLAELEDES